MTFAGGVLIVALCLVLILALVVAWLWQDRKSMKTELADVTEERAAFSDEVDRLLKQASTVQKIEEVRGAQKDKVAAGGVPASIDVLSGIANRAKPKA